MLAVSRRMGTNTSAYGKGKNKKSVWVSVDVGKHSLTMGNWQHLSWLRVVKVEDTVLNAKKAHCSHVSPPSGGYFCECLDYDFITIFANSREYVNIIDLKLALCRSGMHF